MRGVLRVPGDKSISHRAVLFNAVAQGTARITGFASGADCASSIACLRQLGVQIDAGDNAGDLLLKGAGLRGLAEPETPLDCGNSGTTMRLLCGLLAGAGIFAVLTGDGSLRRRPMARVAEPLRAMGASIHGRDGDRLPPLTIAPTSTLVGKEHVLPVASAQVQSSILLAGLQAEGDTVVVEPARSRDHTVRLLSAMGVPVAEEPGSGSANRITLRPGAQPRAVDVDVPGDFSSAAFWLVLACLHPDAEIKVQHVGVNPTRTGLLTILRQMGADVIVENEHDVAGEPVADLVARSSHLTATSVGGALVPLTIDELPLVALLGSAADGETVVTDSAELRVKESDRIAAVASGLQALGADVAPTPDGWRIRGASRPLARVLQPAVVESHGDHRIAMLLALAGALGQGATVRDAAAVSISYPTFWDELARVSGT